MSSKAFSKIAGAQTFDGGNTIRDGNYVFLIERAFLHDGHNGECFIAELRVLESAASGATDETGRPVMPNPAGSTCSLVCNLTKYDAAAGTAKKFCGAAVESIGYTLESLGDQLAQAQNRAKGSPEEALAYLCGDSNPLHGIRIADNTWRSVNKGRYNQANAGKPMTNHKFIAIPQDGEAVSAQRKYLADNKPKADTTAQAQMAAAVGAVASPAAQPAAPAQQQAATPAAQTRPLAGSPLGGILGLK